MGTGHRCGTGRDRTAGDLGGLPCSGQQNSAVLYLGCWLLFGMSPPAPLRLWRSLAEPPPPGQDFCTHFTTPWQHPSSLGRMPTLWGAPRCASWARFSSPHCMSQVLCPQDKVSPAPATLAPCLQLFFFRGLPTGTRVSHCPGVSSFPAVSPVTPLLSTAHGPRTSRAKVLFPGLRLGRCPRRTVLCPGKGIWTGRAREVRREAETEWPQSRRAHGCPREPEPVAVCKAGSAQPYPPSMGTRGSVRALLLCRPSALPFPAPKPFFWQCPSVRTPSCPCTAAVRWWLRDISCPWEPRLCRHLHDLIDPHGPFPAGLSQGAIRGRNTDERWQCLSLPPAPDGPPVRPGHGG